MTDEHAGVTTRDQVPAHEKWDLTAYFADDVAWGVAAGETPVLVERAAAHAGGVMASPSVLKVALDDIMAAFERLSQVYAYARFRSDEDTANGETRAMVERAGMMWAAAGAQLSFLEPEIMAAPAETLAAMLQSSELAGYRHMLEEMARKREHIRSAEVEELLAQSSDFARGAGDIFDALDDADIVYGDVVDEQGATVPLTKGVYALHMESKQRAVRRQAWERLMGAYVAHKHTLAASHAASVKRDVFYARARRYDSAREAALSGGNIPVSVYDSLIEAVREARPTMERYASLRRRLLGLDELGMHDTYVPLSALPERQYTYDEGVVMILDSLAPLGEEYVERLRAGFGGGWVDLRETKGKASGAYSSGAYPHHPVILMNWNGSLDHVFTLTHEAGHAMHTDYATRSQPFHYADYTIFTAEIASTVNETLLTWRLLDITPEDDLDTRFSILNRFADAIQATLVRQTQFAEFEKRTHARVEAGEPLTRDWMCELYGELQEQYVPGTVVDYLVKMTWARIPHFYRAFYVYQYATGISSAIAMARLIRDGGPSATGRYLEMLKSGGADDPLPMLQRAGVDLTTPAPVRSALAEYDRLVREMEHIAIVQGRIRPEA